MAAETPVHSAYAKLDELGLDVPLFKLRERLKAIKARGEDPAHSRNPEAIDEVPHAMVAGVQEMIVTLARHFPMCTISSGGAPRVDRFLKHYVVRECFVEVIGAQTTRRMKPHPEPLLFAAAAMGVQPQECLMIGDTTIDIRTGLAGGRPNGGGVVWVRHRERTADHRRASHAAHDVRSFGRPAPLGGFTTEVCKALVANYAFVRDRL
jgi:HAD superfamily hydrolase (TIGR01549 family)